MTELILTAITILVCCGFLILWLRGQLLMHFVKTQERIDHALSQNRIEMGGRLDSIGKESSRHFEKVQQHLASAELKLASLNTVGQSISDLNQLLKLPHLRGGFGEATLERLLADFLPVGAYELQYAVAPGSSERVDAIVRLARQILPIDSKFPREQVLPLFDSQEGADLDEARNTLAEVIKAQARSIATKYIRPDHGTTDMALMFLPSETLYFEVIRNGALFEAMTKLKVFPVSPNTLSIALHSVSVAQEYYEMSRGVERTIEDLKKARRHFEHFERRFDDVGRSIKKAQEAFEIAHSHLGNYQNSITRLTGADENAAAEVPMPKIIIERSHTVLDHSQPEQRLE